MPGGQAVSKLMLGMTRCEYVDGPYTFWY